MWGSQFVNWDFLEAEGNLGGELLLWDRVVEMFEVAKGMYSILFKFRCVVDWLVI